MLTRAECGKKHTGNPGNTNLLRELEAINRAFNADKAVQRLASSTASSRSKTIEKSHLPQQRTVKQEEGKQGSRASVEKDKRSSIWSWRGLKALTHIRNLRFNCCFSLLVHSVEGLPNFFNDESLVVHWKRRDGNQTTRSVQVSDGVAKFEEQLNFSCSVYGSRSGPHHSAKYEAKHFLLYVSVDDAPELDLGKHRIDLTRLLPLTLEELEQEKGSGNWTTSFRLSGRARGAVLSVSFGYAVVDNNNSINVPKMLSSDQNVAGTVKFTENFDERKDSANALLRKLDDEASISSVEKELEVDYVSSHSDLREINISDRLDVDEEYSERASGKAVFSTADQGMQEFGKGHVKPEFDPSEIEHEGVNIDEGAVKSSNIVEVAGQNTEQSKELIMEDLEEALRYNLDLLEQGLDPEDETDISYAEKHTEVEEFDLEDQTKGKSLSLEDFSDSVANDFLEMLGIQNSPCGNSESEPDSPRERLLREFEKDALACGGLFNVDIDDDDDGSYWGTVSEDNLHDMTTSASEMAHIETETLMREWGINEEVFHDSPSTSSSAFGNSTETPSEDPSQLPPLGDGLGPFVETKKGGFLRSMSPALFKNSKIGGSLIMQASNPVVVPAEMGSNVSTILEGLASVGIEKLSMQAKKLMPLEEVSGKRVQQLTWEGTRNMDPHEWQDSLRPVSETDPDIKHKSVKGKSSIPLSKEDSKSLKKGAEYVSLEDLAPLAMDEIEALSIEGLRVQCGMSNDGASPNISGSMGRHGTCGVQLMNVEDNGEDLDGLMGLSLTLDEWMKLDSGEITDEDLVNEHTSKILAAHHATSIDQFRGRSKGEKSKSRSRKCGLLGNNFTIALMVQLRDPLRDYEAVGSPMLALIQVERVFVPPKPKIYSTVSIIGDSSNENEAHEGAKEKEADEVPDHSVPEFTITEVHVAGLKVDEGKMLWGSKNQQQSSSRWLLANGMAKKTGKHPLLKSKVAANSPAPSSAPITTALKSGGDTLWSVSHRVAHGTMGPKQKKWW